MGEDARYKETYLGDGFLVPILSAVNSDGDWLSVVASGPRGWQLAFTADLTRQEALGHSLLYRTDQGELAMDYQDGQLAIRSAYQRPGFCLAVYSQAGLEYLGVCAVSLAPPAVRDTIADYEGQGYYALARGSGLPLIGWAETAS